MIGQIDHLALGARDLDERIAFYTEKLGMKLKRIGTHVATGGRIAFLADTAGMKLELIETSTEEPGLLHLAYRVDDVEAEYERLLANGCRSIRGPHPLSAAKAVTALVEDPAGQQVQLISYAPDSPDL